MDKVKLEFEAPKTKMVIYNDVTIQVNAYLTMAQQAVLVNKYVEEYFAEEESGLIPACKRHELEAETNLRNYLFQMVTNIDTDSLDNDIYVDEEFWYSITRAIVNYDNFSSLLYNVKDSMEKQIAEQNSVGKIVSGLVGKVNEMINNISSINPEEIAKLQAIGTDLMKQLEQPPVITAPLDINKIPAKRGRKKKSA